MVIQIITRAEDFYALREEWQSLLTSSDQNHLYLTHEYLATWWRHLGGAASLRVIVVRDEHGIAAAAPMMIRWGTLLKMPVRKLEFIGAGWGYGAFILGRGKADCMREITATIQTLRGWDIVSLGQLVDDQDLDAALMSSRSAVHECAPCAVPYIPLQTTWDKYLSERSLSFRRNLRNRSRKLNGLGPVSYQRIQSLEESGVYASTLMQSLRTIADRSWKAGQHTAISSDPRVFAFYSQLAVSLNETGRLDVSILRVNDQPAAYIFGARYDGAFFEIDIAFDDALARTSPGVYLRNCLLQDLIGEGCRVYDFVSYFDYKKELTSHVRQHNSHVFYRRTIYPLVLRSLRSVVRNTMPRLMTDYSDLSWGVIDRGRGADAGA